MMRQANAMLASFGCFRNSLSVCDPCNRAKIDKGDDVSHTRFSG